MDPEWNLKSRMESERTLNGSLMDPEILNGPWTDPEWILNGPWNPEWTSNGTENGTWTDSEILNESPMNLNGPWMEPVWNLNGPWNPQWIPNGSPLEPQWNLNRPWMDTQIPNGPWIDLAVWLSPTDPGSWFYIINIYLYIEKVWNLFSYRPKVIPWESQGLTLSHGPWNLILHNIYLYIYIWIGWKSLKPVLIRLDAEGPQHYLSTTFHRPTLNERC